MSAVLNSIIQKVVFKANQLQHEYISIDILFFILLQETSVRTTLELLDVDVVGLSREIEHYLQHSESYSRLSKEQMLEIGKEQFKDAKEYELAQKAGFYFQPSFTDDFQELLNRVAVHQQSANKSEWNEISLLIFIFDMEESYAAYLLEKYDVDKMELVELVTEAIDPPLTDKENSEDSSLGQYCIDMLQDIGKRDPLIGRLEEKKRIFQILARKTKNNPLIVGEAGVGKTALAYGIATDIAHSRAPQLFHNYRMFMLDVSAVIAGTKYRGDFEKRIKQVFRHLEQMPEQIILFIDELHTIMGLGSTGEGNLDFSNLLKPILEQGKIRCIGSTTFSEYRRFVEKDRAFERRFQKVDINEPTSGETVKILMGLKHGYEQFHGISYSNGIIKKIVELAEKYLMDRNFPDKAIDLMDEVGARNRIKVVKRQKKSASAKDIEQVLSEVAKLPQETMEKSDREKLLQLEDQLKKVIFGQDHVIDNLVDAIVLAKSPFAEHDKPLGQFLFVGPTGVGKTELAKQLASLLGIPFLRYDMSEFMEKHSVAKLIGAPPGYVGYDQGGGLTDDIKKNPHAVLLLDEIEKAHSDILNILLQVMDHGVLTDSKGRETDFRNILIIMTSNIGAKESAGRAIGLSESTGKEFLREKKVKHFFTPEFRNRLTSIEYFLSLPQSALLKVVGKNVQLLQLGLQKHNIRLEVAKEAQEFILKQSFSTEYGARNIKRYIDKHLGLPIAKALLEDEHKNCNIIITNVENNQLIFSYLKKL